jgi:uncharacterized Ntn-hydrolase superfamily protein
MLMLIFSSLPASTTWSIVAADPSTGLLGGAGTSCVGSLGVEIIFAAAPDAGAIHAQAQINPSLAPGELLALGIDRSPRQLAPARGPPTLW